MKMRARSVIFMYRPPFYAVEQLFVNPSLRVFDARSFRSGMTCMCEASFPSRRLHRYTVYIGD